MMQPMFGNIFPVGNENRPSAQPAAGRVVHISVSEELEVCCFVREIGQRARRIIWLNPESRNTWGFGDSEMERYAIHCDLVEECRNLNQLYRVIDQLVPR